MNRFKISLYVALAGLLLMVIGFSARKAGVDIGMGILGVGILAGWVSYIFAGVTQALAIAWGMFKFGLRFPVFPANFVVAMFMIIPIFYVVVCLPIIPVGMTYMKNRDL